MGAKEEELLALLKDVDTKDLIRLLEEKAERKPEKPIVQAEPKPGPGTITHKTEVDYDHSTKLYIVTDIKNGTRDTKRYYSASSYERAGTKETTPALPVLTKILDNYVDNSKDADKLSRIIKYKDRTIKVYKFNIVPQALYKEYMGCIRDSGQMFRSTTIHERYKITEKMLDRVSYLDTSSRLYYPPLPGGEITSWDTFLKKEEARLKQRQIDKDNDNIIVE